MVASACGADRAADTVPPTTVKTAPAADHAEWAREILASGRRPSDDELATRFSRSFLAAVPPDEVRRVLAANVRGQWSIGRSDRDGRRSVTHLAGPDGVELVLSLELDGDGRIAGALLEPAAAPVDDWRAAVHDLVAAGAPGAVVVVRTGDRVERVAAGVSDRSSGRAASVHDRTRIGSVTKPFVAALVMRLVADGRVALDDDVERHLPGLLRDGRRVTVRHLLAHRSGLADYANDAELGSRLSADPTRVWTPRELVSLSQERPPIFAPGSRHEYSNTNYIVLGLLIERIGHTSLARAIADLTTTIGLKDTLLLDRPEIPGSHLTGHVGAGQEPVPAAEPSWAWAAGAMVSTGDDLTAFLAALQAGQVVPRPQYEEMIAATTDEHADGYGLGLFRAALPCGVAYGHNGDFPGWATLALTREDGSRQIALAINTSFTPALSTRIEAIAKAALCSA